MKESPNLGLHLTSDEDKALPVAQWVERQAGDSDDSNMMKLDAAVGSVRRDIEDHGADTGNPHGVTAAQAQAIPADQKGVAGGVAELDSTGKVPETQLPDMAYDPLGSAANVENALSTHTANTGNPHGVTAAQAQAIPTAQKGAAGGVAELGADGKVPGEQLPDLNYDPLGSADSVRHELQGHTLATNPHNVTAAQVGLGNVDDTRDEEKPLSQAVRDALAALEAKIEIAAASGQKKLVATFTEDGIFRPADYGLENQYVDVYMVGGGGGGCLGISSDYGGGRGGGGYCLFLKNVLLAESSYAIIVGAGGEPGTAVKYKGGAGGDTIAFGVTAQGGQEHPSTAVNAPMAGAPGGSGGGAGTSLSSSGGGHGGAFGGSGGCSTTNIGGEGGGNNDYCPVNPYDNIPYGCGGGGGGNRLAPGGGASGQVNIPSGLGGGGHGGGGDGFGNIFDGGTGGQGGGGGGGGLNGATAAGAGGDGIVYIYA